MTYFTYLNFYERLLPDKDDEDEEVDDGSAEHEHEELGTRPFVNHRDDSPAAWQKSYDDHGSSKIKIHNEALMK